MTNSRALATRISRPIDSTQYSALLTSLNELWGSPSTPDRETRMDTLIALIDEYESKAMCQDLAS